ncbi:MAG TPA: SWIM zinc finger family protein [Candidatus Binataceae bacterium]|nr:SWIM zinc finger family protein [Candidatus Binataceae bacterium]
MLHLAIDDHKATATVQGSIPIPYNVSIELRRISMSQWRKAGTAIASKVAIAARLMAGALPPEAEECFAEAGVALFPACDADLIASCDCPDFSNPCKHIAAVYYLLAERFDRDPFLLFRLRGMEREQFVAMLGKGERPSPERAPVLNEAEPSPATCELAANAEVFWRGRPLPDDSYGRVALSEEPAPVARRLGSIPFWRGKRDFLEAISDLSSGAAESAVAILVKSAAPGAPR